VINKETKKSKGIAFIDFETSDAAEGAISTVRKDILMVIKYRYR
jgi:RNA recognition motif-containing protein